MVLVSCGLPQQADNILHLPTCPVISFSEPAGKQGFVWGWEAINKGLVSAADRACMKAPSLVHRPQPMGQNVPNLWTP